MAVNVPQIGIPNALAKLLMNPKQVARLAQQMANLQYGDTISTIRSGIGAEGTRHDRALADLASWFGQVQGANTQSQEGVRARMAQMLQGHDSAVKGLAGLTGGDAGVAHALSTSSLASRAGLEGIGAAQDNFQENMKSVLGLQQNEANMMEGRRNSDRSADLEAALGQALTQRGNAAAQFRSTLMDQNFRNRIAAMDAGLAQALGGPQVASALLGLQGQQLDNKGKQTGIAGAKLDNEIKRLQIAAGLIDLNSPREKERASIPEFNGLMPDQLQGLEEALLGRVVVKDRPGQLGVNPLKAWSDMGSALRRLSNGAWNPKQDGDVKSFRDGLIRERIASWNRMHPKQKYTWRGGRPVFIGDGKHPVHKGKQMPDNGTGAPVVTG